MIIIIIFFFFFFPPLLLSACQRWLRFSSLLSTPHLVDSLARYTHIWGGVVVWRALDPLQQPRGAVWCRALGGVRVPGASGERGGVVVRIEGTKAVLAA